jgi:beta-galactosidase
MHERYIEQIDDAGIFWGVWIDNMFDYASARRTYGLNQAGMVGYDHEQRKDAYYLYRARWNGDVPTLHIADRGWHDRRDDRQVVDVYSSVGEPILIVDSDTIPTRSVGRAHYRADSVMLHGATTIRATDASGRYHDRVTLNLVRLCVTALLFGCS